MAAATGSNMITLTSSDGVDITIGGFQHAMIYDSRLCCGVATWSKLLEADFDANRARGCGAVDSDQEHAGGFG